MTFISSPLSLPFPRVLLDFQWVHALNQSIRDAVRPEDKAQNDVLLTTETAQRAFGADDRIVFNRNDKELGVKNGMLGTVVSATASRVRVALDGDAPKDITFDPCEYRQFDHGYAVTIHKSQGATVDRAYLLDSRTMDRHLAYVAMTRHRSEMKLFLSAEDRPSWARAPSPHRERQQTRLREGPSMG